MLCQWPNGRFKKFGFFGPSRTQRYRCVTCGKTFCAPINKPLDDHRISDEKALHIVHLLVEGVGVRAISRLTGANKRTVLRILETAGEKCARLLDEKVMNLAVDYCQVDELWSFVHSKQANAVDPEHGDAYTYLGIDKRTKLIIAHRVAKRDEENTFKFIGDLHSRIATHCQITVDGWSPYLPALFTHFGRAACFAQMIKIYHADPFLRKPERRYSPGKCVGARVGLAIGHPAVGKISTSHAERTNLSVRLFNRRFTRLTLGYSKKLANLRHSVALFVAHFNFCRVHSAHGKTPAHAQGLTAEKWSIERLLKEAIRQEPQKAATL